MHLYSLAPRGRWHVSDGQNHCTAYLVCLLRSGFTPHEGWGTESVSDMFVLLTFIRQDLMYLICWFFLLLLDTSVAISPELKLFECCSLRAATANKKGWGASDEEQNDTDLKMSAGVALLIVYSHSSAHRCARSRWKLLADLNYSYFLYN